MFAIVSKPGQLGNRLWLAAHIYGLAMELGEVVWNTSLDEYASLFPSTRGSLRCRFPVEDSHVAWPSAWPPESLRRLVFESGQRAMAAMARVPNPGLVQVVDVDWDETFDLSDPGFQEMCRTTRLVVFRGLRFRYDDAVARHAGRIRAHFTPGGDIYRRGQQIVDRLRRRYDRVIGIHMRRGDYRYVVEGRYFFDYGVYRDIIRSMQERFDERLGFMVCSDELGSGVIESFGADAYHGPGGWAEDLWALSQCDAIVGPPSTYSMWASFAGQTPVFTVFQPGSPSSFADFKVRMTNFLDDEDDFTERFDAAYRKQVEQGLHRQR